MIDNSVNRSVLIVGSVAFDDVDGPFGLQRDVLGGSASFASTVASYFTNNTQLVAVVGEDFGTEHVEWFEQRGIDISGLERAAGDTFHWSGVYSDNLASRQTLDTRLGVFADFHPKLNDHHRAAELVLLGNIAPELQLEVLEQVRAPELIVADTMNLWIETSRDALLEVLARVHTLLINDEEARQLADEHNLVRAADKIRALGPHSVVIKRGDAGALLFWEGGAFATPALPLQDVRDPTGAGDSFAGGFLGYLAHTGALDPRSIRLAMICGSVMASFCVEQFSIDGLRGLSAKDIQGRMDTFFDLCNWQRISLA